MGALVELTLQTFAAGVMTGCIYGLMCVGLAVIFGIMRVINFAQGDFMMIGMYAAIFLATSVLPPALFGASLPIVSALLAGPALFIAGYALNRLLISGATGLNAVGDSERDTHQTQLILTLGIALVIENGTMIILGSEPVAMLNPLSSSAWELPLLYDDFSAVFLNKGRALGALISVAISLAVFWFIATTRIGKRLRAAAINPEAALYMGIDVTKAHHIAFGLGSAIAGIAGGLVAVYYPAHPFVGNDFLIIIYAGVVLGGLGSLAGAYWGGLIIGLIQQLSTLILPLQLQNATIFVVFVLILLFRPQGLFGRVVERA